MKSIITVIIIFILLITGIWFYSSKYEKKPITQIQKNKEINNEKKQFETMIEKNKEIGKEASNMLPVKTKEKPTILNFEEDFFFQNYALKGSRHNVLMLNFSLNKNVIGNFTLKCIIKNEDNETILKNTISNDNPDVTHFHNFLMGEVKTPVKEVNCELIPVDKVDSFDMDDNNTETDEKDPNQKSDEKNVLDVLGF